ncbi:uncharacterized protein EI97DRAFT_431569 [Westerdykella ornata]|uniref:Uncharacterized protein n=1 Tax=Westerdykella ornata TaxID=318751 RepID=A0A6A6JP72_WESOR|nr:uncharacterized protein EI97DRAFT_431569 [Westerdykella ornata]KAF2278322.1 hypothetical protein EI97DRAFT_431569 [Westerdykella ornata]
MPPTQLCAVPSPKRKRDNLPPALSTSSQSALEPAAPSSPTTNGIVDQLRDLRITALSALPRTPLTPIDDMVRKKPKLEAMDDTQIFRPAPGTVGEIELATAEIQDVVAEGPWTGSAAEISETPQAHAERHHPVVDFEDSIAIARPVVFGAIEASAFAQNNVNPKSQKARSKANPSRPRSRRSPSPPPISLTWQDSEITGHLADPSTDPDDDGTGINGIGFKPTPAIAYARAQKRRQQLLEWRARETREARAKRSERRRRGVAGAGSSSREGTVEREIASKEHDATRRAVRFAI